MRIGGTEVLLLVSNELLQQYVTALVKHCCTAALHSAQAATSHIAAAALPSALLLLSFIH
jgi:hypothetical protein